MSALQLQRLDIFLVRSTMPRIRDQLKFASLGQTWVNLVDVTIQHGQRMGEEGLELLGVQVEFPVNGHSDPVIERFGDPAMVAEMNKVFFADGPNSLGHSYAELMRGPAGRSDLQDIIEMLQTNSLSKRAVMNICGHANGKVPCINTVQFLVRGEAVHTMYFARGQDAFRKFYADGLCLAAMARTVASGLARSTGTVSGFIASSHVYDGDLPEIRELLVQAKEHLDSDQ